MYFNLGEYICKKIIYHKMKKAIFLASLIGGLFLTSCSSDDDSTTLPQITAPDTYVFERNGETTVSFGGQTTRIEMASEFSSALVNSGLMTAELQAMFAHEKDNNDFSNVDLNGSSKNLKSKTAASKDFFSSNTTDATAIKTDFTDWITKQSTDVFANWTTAAAPGTAGQIARGSKTAYVDANGLELNQVIAKSLIGALMADQMLNSYLGTTVLDEADNRTNNDAGTVATDKNYTTMEHKWDEAYGYIYGKSDNTANPNLTIGDDDSFLNKYTGKVDGDDDFKGIATTIWDAFRLGRAAIVAKNYEVRDAQAQIIRENISKVIAVRAVHYLQAGKSLLNPTDMGPAFHDLSEGYGFVYSLQFTRKPGTNESYFTKADIDEILEKLLQDGANGLWDVEAGTLDAISETIAAKFGFTVAQAAN